MFATDHLHYPDSPGPLYGSIPYVTALTTDAATGLLWVNSAKTTIDIDESEDTSGQAGLTLTYSSEANSLEFFMISSAYKPSSNSDSGSATNRVKLLHEDLATVTGFAPMPLIHSLGYHFCKWYPVSADMLMQRNADFTTYGFPIDVLWSDIEWAQQNDDPEGYEYFKFNPLNFTTDSIAQMNTEIENSGRRIVVIVDPHIKASDDYFVYKEGMVL